MKDFWANIEGVKQLLYVVILLVIVIYAAYHAKFDFLTGISTGIFAALGIMPKGVKE
jgi:hypothetical protein